jgi:hypothetical protein
MLLFLFKTARSKKTKISQSKKEEIPVRYNIEPKSSHQYPLDTVNYKVTVINDKHEDISGKVRLTPPEDWNVLPIMKEYGPLKQDEKVDLEFEFQIPESAQTGFIYKVAGVVFYGSDQVECSAMIELVEKGEELLW